jgi:hypothetical protein
MKMIDSKTSELWQDSVWGAPLKPLEKTLVINAEGKEATLADVLHDFKDIPETPEDIKSVMNRLMLLAEMIEGDIEYFSKFPGQSMATNRLSMIKGLIGKEIKALESL